MLAYNCNLKNFFVPLTKLLCNQNIFSPSCSIRPFVLVKRLSSSQKSLDLSGVFPPIITNFDERANIVYGNTSKNLERWNNISLRGYVVLGSTGEFVCLTEEERCELVKYVRKHVPSNKLVIVGSGCESTFDTINQTNKMADVGANAALIISPCFYKGRMTDDVLYYHYMKVADSSKIPVILYSVPANTSIDLGVSVVAKLAKHPNIIGMKDSGGDITKMAHIVHKTQNENFQMLAGSAGFFYPALSIGCVGGVMALANILGQSLCDLYSYALKGYHDKARELQLKLVGPNLAVTKQFGIPGVKAAMDLAGYIGGTCRSPLQKLSPNDLELLKKEFQENGFL